MYGFKICLVLFLAWTGACLLPNPVDIYFANVITGICSITLQIPKQDVDFYVLCTIDKF